MVFYLTHVVEPIEFPSQDEVNGYLPPLKYPLPLNPDKPVTMGSFCAAIYLYRSEKSAGSEYQNIKKGNS